MTLLITVLAAVVCTVLWYRRKNDEMRLGTLCFMFWGASLMWLGDAIWEFAEDNEAFFSPELSDMLNDAFLGLSVVALALVVWLVILLIKDPKGSVKKALLKK
ncbi:MAG: hypothetical protein IK136_05600 [Oscillospiraceae bacterium]|nr:hypothetical protein [Oscillospiraceae bacterium]